MKLALSVVLTGAALERMVHASVVIAEQGWVSFLVNTFFATVAVSLSLILLKIAFKEIDRD